MDKPIRPYYLKMFVYRLLRKWIPKQETLHLARVIQQVLGMPISQRKIVITACQTWDVDYSTFSNISEMPDRIDPFHHGFVSKRLFLESLEHVVSCPVQASIVWMISWTCPEPPDADEHMDVYQ